MVLLGIDMPNGSETGRVPMPEKGPQFTGDAIGSRVYYFKDNKDLLVYDF